jgi:predicted nucleic acid-binding protein
VSRRDDPWHGLERIALDTNALIYYLDGVAPYAEPVTELLRRAEAGSLEIIVPGLVELELRVGPLRDGDEEALRRIDLLLDHFPGLRVAPMGREAARAAAGLRAEHGIKTPDALVAGVAVVEGCDAIVGNDRRCADRLREPRYVLLDGLVGRA